MGTEQQVPTLRRIPLDRIVESSLNPRQHYDEAKLDQLGESLAAKGQFTPAIVRPVKGADDHYELAAGHRRFRAAARRGLPDLLCDVREMDDAEFLEVMAIEQLQHEDFTPLEEARAYDNLRRLHLSDAAIAERVKKDRRYVSDRLLLLDLVPDAERLLRENRITVDHAVLVARLSPADQQRVLDEDGLMIRDRSFFDDGGMVDVTHDRFAGTKAVSVAELRKWIDTNVRLKLEEPIVADLFPETVAAVQEAEEAKRKHVFITHLRNIPDAAKDGTRILKPTSWRPAGEKPCSYTILGTVLIGPQRGESLHVCTSKRKCEVHWADEIKRAALSVSRPGASGGDGESRGMTAAQRKEQERHEAEVRKAEAERAKWREAAPAIVEAIARKIAKMPATPKVAAVREFIPFSSVPPQFKDTAKIVPIGTTAESFVRHLVLVGALEGLWSDYHYAHSLPGLAKTFGVDVKAIFKGAAASATKAKPAAKKAAPTKAAKKKGGRR